MAASTSGEARPRVSTGEEEEEEGEGEEEEEALALAAAETGRAVAIVFTESGALRALRLPLSMLPGTERKRRLPSALTLGAGDARREGPKGEARATTAANEQCMR